MRSCARPFAGRLAGRLRGGRDGALDGGPADRRRASTAPSGGCAGRSPVPPVRRGARGSHGAHRGPVAAGVHDEDRRVPATDQHRRHRPRAGHVGRAHVDDRCGWRGGLDGPAGRARVPGLQPAPPQGAEQQYIRTQPTWQRVTPEVSGFVVPHAKTPWGRPLWVAIYRKHVHHRTAKTCEWDLFNPDDGHYEYSAVTSNLDLTQSPLRPFETSARPGEAARVQGLFEHPSPGFP
jgi:hypothetical protein